MSESHPLSGFYRSKLETIPEESVTAPLNRSSSEENGYLPSEYSLPSIRDEDLNEEELQRDLTSVSRNSLYSGSDGMSVQFADFEPSRDALQEMDCTICFETLPRSEFPSRSLTALCSHRHLSCCSGCLQSSIKSDFEQKMWNAITCPECLAAFAYEDLREFADPETFERYDELTARAAMNSLPNFVWCTTCSSGQIHEEGVDQPIVECHGCGDHSCFTHRTTWHIGLSCEEYDILYHESQRPRWQRRISKVARFISHSFSSRVRQAKRFFLSSSASNYSTRVRNPGLSTPTTIQSRQTRPTPWMSAQTRECEEAMRLTDEELKGNKQQWKQERKTKRVIDMTCQVCPGPGCGWPIEKNKGCPHIVCTQCHHEFCYECLAEYTAVLDIGTNQHKPSCRYFRDSLP